MARKKFKVKKDDEGNETVQPKRTVASTKVAIKILSSPKRKRVSDYT